MGFGDTLQEIFNPTSFDVDQIAKAAASTGLKGLIAVAKHHDGFCFWPIKITSYSIVSSSWKGGKGGKRLYVCFKKWTFEMWCLSISMEPI